MVRFTLMAVLCGVFLLGKGTFVLGQDEIEPVAIDPIGASTAGTSEGRRRAIERKLKLERRLDEAMPGVEFNFIPLSAVLVEFSKQTGIEFLIEEEALIDEGISLETEIKFSTAQAKITVRDALRAILTPLNLVAINDSGVVRLTTGYVEEKTLEVRVYNVRNFLKGAAVSRGTQWAGRPWGFNSAGAMGCFPGSGPRPCLDADPMSELMNAVITTTTGPWLAVDGIGGTLDQRQGLLVVYQSQRVHREIADLFRQLRAADESRDWSEGFPKNPTAEDKAEQAAYNEQLRRRIEENYKSQESAAKDSD
ncbi:hypothetical protein [Stratiformator vulcanicus]|uniref:Uncharacterized protein n=1 Tax=Stratiformator vulcanicus TaxID=2527980 RepID=A0A517QXY7_9PLAN|nr:hypothetical protein [Stratiformator vulcanicus]QDT36474.1 hypothetical protein Pan189_08310 [Stratiformator vulcanicus]